MDVISGFQFRIPTKLVFGMGSAGGTAPIASQLVSGPALVVSDPGIVQAGLLDPILSSLKGSGVEPVVFSDDETNPRDSSVDSAGDLARERGCALVIGVGGGSALDTAKAAGFLATNRSAVGWLTLAMLRR
jgi:alcohol dehydrogenase class IV